MNFKRGMKNFFRFVTAQPRKAKKAFRFFVKSGKRLGKTLLKPMLRKKSKVQKVKALVAIHQPKVHFWSRFQGGNILQGMLPFFHSHPATGFFKLWRYLAMAFFVSLMSVAGALSLQYVLAQGVTWQGPSAAPSGNNVPAPLNVGSTAQTKLGNLSVDGNVWLNGNMLNIAGITRIEDAFIVEGSVVAGNHTGARGLQVGRPGNNGMQIQASENLIYGNLTSSSVGNALLLEKNGSRLFQVNTDGDVVVKGGFTVAGERVCLENGAGCPVLSGADGNNFVTDITVNGVSQKTVTLTRSGLSPLTTTFNDLDTTYTAGSGLTLTGGAFGLNTTDIASCTNSATQKIYWNNGTGRFACATDQTGSGGSGGVIGVGLTNFLTKWESGSILRDSIIFDNGTNVGVGTNSPTQKLDVFGSARMSGDVFSNRFVDNNNNSYYVDPSNTSITANLAGEVRSTVFRDVDSIFYFVDPAATGNSALLAGNVGIGTLTPTQKLDVVGSARMSGDVFSNRFVDINNNSYYVDSSNTSTSANFAGSVQGSMFKDINSSYYIDPDNTSTSAVLRGGLVTYGDIVTTGGVNAASGAVTASTVNTSNIPNLPMNDLKESDFDTSAKGLMTLSTIGTTKCSDICSAHGLTCYIGMNISAPNNLTIPCSDSTNLIKLCMCQ